MPANSRSLRLTGAYRSRLIVLSDRIEREASQSWPTIEELDSSDWVETIATAVNRAQVEGVRLTGAYLGAFLRSETSKGRAPALDTRRYAGITRDGRPLRDAFTSPIIGVKVALKEGRSPDDALGLGLTRAKRMVGFETIQASREALLDAIDADDRFEGWTRATRGTCGACLAKSGEVSQGLAFEVHAGCQCVSVPVVSGVGNTFPIPTGAVLFAQKSEEEQDASLGPKAAALVRSGEANLEDLVAHSKLDSDQPDWITQRPISDVAA